MGQLWVLPVLLSSYGPSLTVRQFYSVGAGAKKEERKGRREVLANCSGMGQLWVLPVLFSSYGPSLNGAAMVLSTLLSCYGSNLQAAVYASNPTVQ